MAKGGGFFHFFTEHSILNQMFRPLLLGLLFLFSIAHAQHSDCGFDFEHQSRLQNDQDYRQAVEQVDQSILQSLNSPQPEMGVLTIPVVFHVIYGDSSYITPGTFFNPEDSLVLEGLANLNKSFANVGIYDSLTGVDIEIEFCLASQDTNGNYTSGIERYPGNAYANPPWNNFIRSLSWDPHHYLNIYLVSGIFIGNSSWGGFSSFPSAHGQSNDGFLVTKHVLFSPLSATTLTHEAGHYLGLYHTFQGGCVNNDCQVDGDRVCDTPPDASDVFVATCQDSVNTCISDTADLSLNNPFRPISMGGLGDQNDPIHNYMDYTPALCRNQFTQGQKDRMRSSLTNIRGSLLNSTVCQPVCSQPMTAFFSQSADTLSPGDTIYFSNGSQGQTWTQWQINGQPFSSANDTSNVFSQEGRFLISLRVANDSSRCDTMEFHRWFWSICPLDADFTLSADQIAVGDSVTVQSSGSGGAFTWLENGNRFTGPASRSFTYTQPGVYELQLEVGNGACLDSSATKKVFVNHCLREQQSQWVGGYKGGVNFNTSPPTTYIVPDYTYLYQNTASVADDAGNLLFFSNGFTVINALLDTMPNGDSLNQFGTISVDQPVQILPVPGHPQEYYLFSIEGYNPVGGLNVARIDMRADSGRGDVVSKGQQLLSVPIFSLERTWHENSGEYWLIARERLSQTIHSFHVSPQGISAPVVSTLPGPLAGSSPIQSATTLDGSRIAHGIIDRIRVSDFDRQTGLSSNTYDLTPVGGYFSGIEFSPSGRYLYASLNANNGPHPILQFDLEAGNPAAVQSSLTIVHEHVSAYNSLRLGPDGKIYISQFGSFVATLNNPNQKGAAADFQLDGIRFPNGAAFYGEIPETPPSYLHTENIKIYGPETACAGATGQEYRIALADSAEWVYAGGGSLDSVSATFASISFAGAGTETLVVRSWSACGEELRDTLQITVTVGQSFSLGSDTLLCPGDSLLLQAPASMSQFQWQNGSNAASVVADSVGWYWLRAQDSVGCLAEDSLYLSYVTQAPAAVDLGNDTLLCPGASLNLQAGPAGYTYLWQNGATTPNISLSSPGTYWVEVMDSCGNLARDSILVAFSALPQVQLGNDTILCPGQGIALSAGTGAAQYLWQNGATSATIQTGGSGLYWVEKTDLCGNSVRDSIWISEVAAPVFSLGNDTTLCPGQSFNLQAPAGFASVLWSDNSQGNSLAVSQPGWIWLEISDTCGQVFRDSLLVAADAPQGMDLGPDTVICGGQTLILRAGSGFSSYLWSDGSTGDTLAVTQAGIYWVEGTNAAGCSYRDTLVLTPCVGLNPASQAFLQVYPNPTQGDFHIWMRGIVPGESWRIALFDVRGKEVASWERKSNHAEVRWKFEPNHLSSGLYLLSLRSPSQNRTLKVLLE